MFTYSTSVYNTSVVFPHLQSSSSTTEFYRSQYTSSTSFNTTETLDVGTTVLSNTGSFSESSISSSVISSSQNFQKYFYGGFPAQSGETMGSAVYSSRYAGQGAGAAQFGPNGTYVYQSAYNTSGATYNRQSTIAITYGSDGFSYETLVSNYNFYSASNTDSGAATFVGGGTGSNSFRQVFGNTQSVSLYNRRYEYQRGETQISNEYYSASSSVDGTFSTSTSFYSATVFTEYPTEVSTSFFTTQTGTTTSQTATSSETYEGRLRYQKEYTVSTDAGPQYVTSVQSSHQFVFLTHTSSQSGTNSYITITTSTSSASRVSTSYGSQRPVLAISYTTSFYQPLGMPATVLKNISHWKNGNVGGFLRKLGNNGNLVQSFSAFNIVVSDETLLPVLSMGTYGITDGTNSDTYTLGQVVNAGTSDQLTGIYGESFQNVSYGWGGGSVTSETFEDYFSETYSYEAYFNTTATTDFTVFANSYPYSYVATIGYNITTSQRFVAGSNANFTSTIHSLANTTITGIRYSLLPALSSEDGTSESLGASYTFFRNGYRSYEKQSFNTATAKAFSYLGRLYHVSKLENKNGQKQYGRVYLHTSVSNKTDNTGFWLYGNNLSLDPQYNPLSYNANTVIGTRNQQLIGEKQLADSLYANSPHFAGTVQADDYLGGNALTPMTQSSYILYDGGYYTVTFDQSGGSYIEEGATTTGQVVHTFSSFAGTGLGDIQLHVGGQLAGQGIGGKRALYTGLQTLYINTLGRDFRFTIRNSELTLNKSLNYTFINYGSGVGTGTESYTLTIGSIPIASSQVTGLKYMTVDGDSWVAVDAQHGLNLSAVQLGHPDWASTAPNAGILALGNGYADRTYYYGSTYWEY
jgi:hypothetical protein